MDLRSLIKLAPAMFRAPLLSLLDRLEGVEKAQYLTAHALSEAHRAIVAQGQRLDLLQSEIERARKS